MMKIRLVVGIFLTCSVLWSCTKEETPVQEKIIASIDNNVLTETELKNAIYPYANSKDSAKYANEYIDNWLSEKIMLREAERLLTDTAEIADKIENYRCQLYVHEYCEKYIYSNVNMTVTEKEINEYYDTHLNDYVINTTYVKAHYITISPKIISYYTFLEKLRDTDLDSENELNDFCSSGDRTAYFFKDWIEINDFIKVINYPGNIAPEELKYKNTLDYIHDTLRYLVKIDDYIVPGDLLPIELAKSKIIQIIMNKRKHDKYKQAKEDLLSKFKQDNIYIDKQ